MKYRQLRFQLEKNLNMEILQNCYSPPPKKEEAIIFFKKKIHTRKRECDSNF